MAIAGLGALLYWSFIESREEATREAQRERPMKAPLRVRGTSGAPVITLDDEAQRSSGIEVSGLRPAPFQPEVRAYGMVLDSARLTEVSNNYANAKAQRLTAQARLTASKAAFERSEALYKDQQNVSLAQLQTAEAAYRSDQALLAAADSQVRSLAATARQEWGAVLGQSLIDGSPLVQDLIERQSFLLQVTLPAGMILPRVPATAFLETPRAGRGQMRFISPATRTDPRIQGLSFFYIASADTAILPGMNVVAFLPSGGTVDGVTVPAAAIVWWQDRAWVYRRTGPDTFTRIEIATDQPGPDGGFIVKDFPTNAEIVISGAQLLLSEEFRAQIQVEGD